MPTMQALFLHHEFSQPQQMAVQVIFYCVTNHPKTWSLKVTVILLVNLQLGGAQQGQVSAPRWLSRGLVCPRLRGSLMSSSHQGTTQGLGSSCSLGWSWVAWVRIGSSCHENQLSISASSLLFQGELCLCLGRSQAKQKISTENGGNTPTEVLIAT